MLAIYTYRFIIIDNLLNNLEVKTYKKIKMFDWQQEEMMNSAGLPMVTTVIHPAGAIIGHSVNPESISVGRCIQF